MIGEKQREDMRDFLVKAYADGVLYVGTNNGGADDIGRTDIFAVTRRAIIEDALAGQSAVLSAASLDAIVLTDSVPLSEAAKDALGNRLTILSLAGLFAEAIRRIAARSIPGAPHEVLLVLDAVTGMNGIAQAREFTKSAGVTGLVLTKMDGTAKGGVILAIVRELALPVRYVGVGETTEDLLDFDAAAFAGALVDD